MMLLAAVEGGGQSWVCALASGDRDNIVEMATFPTLDPDRTLGEIKAWLVARKEKLRGIGIATFGPINARPASNRFGFITSTPKEGWGQTDLQREEELLTLEREVTRSIVESLRGLKAELETTQWMYRDDLF